jgi:hypothetical protein
MPSNITLIDNPYYDLCGQTVIQYQVESLTEAIETARGRAAYLYKSNTIEALYLYVPVVTELVSVIHAGDVLLVAPTAELVHVEAGT